MNTQPPPTSEQLGRLVAAVGIVMTTTGAVEKTGQTTTGAIYTYASDADLLYALRPAMAENGLALFPIKQDVAASEATGTKMKHRVRTVTTWRLIHTGGGWIETQSIGEGADSLDKASYKAQTGALKYALRAVFLVPTGDDPERDTRNAPPQWSDAVRIWFGAALDRIGVKLDHFGEWFVEVMGSAPLESRDRTGLATVLADLADPESGMLGGFNEWLAVRRKQLEEEPATWSDDDRVAFCKFLAGIGLKHDDVEAYCLDALRPKPSSASHEYRRGLAAALENGERAKFSAWLKARAAADLQWFESELQAIGIDPVDFSKWYVVVSKDDLPPSSKPRVTLEKVLAKLKAEDSPGLHAYNEWLGPDAEEVVLDTASLAKLYAAIEALEKRALEGSGGVALIDECAEACGVTGVEWRSITDAEALDEYRVELANRLELESMDHGPVERDSLTELHDSIESLWGDVGLDADGVVNLAAEFDIDLGTMALRSITDEHKLGHLKAALLDLKADA